MSDLDGSGSAPGRVPHVDNLLKRASAVRRLDALFRAMAADFLLREQFVTDPAQVISEYVGGKAVPAGAATISNHLLYASLSNRRLRAWMTRYAVANLTTPPTQIRFLTEFGQAVAEYGDQFVTFALIRTSVDEYGTAGFANFQSILSSLIAVLGQRGGVSVTGGPPTGGPPTGGPPTGGPPTGGPPTGGPPTGGPPTGGPPTGGPPTGGPPTGGPPTGGPPTGGPPTGGPPTGDDLGSLRDDVLLAIDELVQYAEQLKAVGALNLAFASEQEIAGF